MALNWPAWQLPSLIGLLVGSSIPTSWGLVAGTLALAGTTYSLLERPGHLDRAAVVAGAAAVAALAPYEAEHPNGHRRRGGR